MKRPPNRVLLPLALGVAALLLWDTVTRTEELRPDPGETL